MYTYKILSRDPLRNPLIGSLIGAGALAPYVELDVDTPRAFTDRIEQLLIFCTLQICNIMMS